jgi:ribosomal protein L40E
MKCATCGTLNRADAAFCKGCGNKLGVRECPGCGVPIDSDALFCSQCGFELSADIPSANSKTCQSCGFVNPPATVYCRRCNQKII